MSKLIIDVISDLYRAGVTEDGEDYTAEMYKILAESEDGSRWVHNMTFAGCCASYTEDGVYFDDIREEAMKRAKAFANKIRKHLANGGSLDLDCWVERDPAYGSRAYQELDVEGYFYKTERQRAGY